MASISSNSTVIPRNMSLSHWVRDFQNQANDGTDRAIRPWLDQNCNTFVTPPPQEVLAEDVRKNNSFILETDRNALNASVASFCAPYPGKYFGTKDHDQAVDDQCVYRSCMMRYRLPMNMTTAVPVMARTANTSYYIAMVTRTFPLTTDHWGHAFANDVRFPTTASVYTLTKDIPVTSTMSLSTITAGPTSGNVVQNVFRTNSTFVITRTKYIEAVPPQELLRRHQEDVDARENEGRLTRQGNFIFGDRYRLDTCYDFLSCHNHCAGYVRARSAEIEKENQATRKLGRTGLIWLIVGILAGVILLALLLCCCWRRHRRNRKDKNAPLDSASTVTTVIDPATGRPIAGASSLVAQSDMIAPATGAAGAAIVAGDGRGTLGRQAEEGRGRVHFPEGEKGAEVVGAPAAATEKVVEVAPASAAEKVVEKPAQHVETVPVPVHDGADNNQTTGSDRPDMGSVRGRKLKRFGL